MNDYNTNSSSPLSDLQRQQLLLRMEYEYEKEEFCKQTGTMSIARRVKRELCWYPVSTDGSFCNSLNRLVIEVERQENREVEHALELRCPVCFFEQGYDGSMYYLNSIYTASYVDEERMVVVVPGAGALLGMQKADRLGVQSCFDGTSYHSMFETLEDVARVKGNRLVQLCDILLNKQPSQWKEIYPIHFP